MTLPITGANAAPLEPTRGANRQQPQPLTVQFLRYLACSGVAAAVNFGAGSVLVDGFGLTSRLGFPLAVMVAYLFGMVVNFGLNRQFTFTSERRQVEQVRTFVVVALGGLLLTTATAALARAALAATLGNLFPDLLGSLGTPESLGRAVAIALVSVYSFAGHKYFTFGRGIRFSLVLIAHTLQLGR